MANVKRKEALKHPNVKRSFNQQVYKAGKLELLSHCLVVHGHRQANYHHEHFGKFFHCLEKYSN